MTKAHFITNVIGAALLPRSVVLTCVCVPTVQVQLGYDLVGRIRGAWGQRIRSRTLSGCEQAIALNNACFGTGLLSRPYIINASVNDIQLSLTLTLIGWAHIWQDVAFECFLEALESEPGIAFQMAINTGSAPVRIIDVYWRRYETMPLRHRQSHARFSTSAPIRLGTRRSLASNFDGLFPALVKRVTELATWSYASVQMEPSKISTEEMYGTARPLKMHAGSFWRNSSRTQSRGFHVGLVGTVLCENLTPLGWALLCFGERFGVGQDVSLGMGRFIIDK